MFVLLFLKCSFPIEALQQEGGRRNQQVLLYVGDRKLLRVVIGFSIGYD